MEEFRRTPGVKARSAAAWAFPVVLGALSFASSPLQHASEPPPDEASVVVRNLSQPGSFEVENRGPDIELAWEVTIQRELKGEWSDHVTDLTLIEKCGISPPAGCVPLPHGAKLRPVRWNGL